MEAANSRFFHFILIIDLLKNIIPIMINTIETKADKIPTSDTLIGVAISVAFNKTIKPSAIRIIPIDNFFSEIWFQVET
jgi:hypothetical protein